MDHLGQGVILRHRNIVVIKAKDICIYICQEIESEKTIYDEWKSTTCCRVRYLFCS
jgi:hypothetical protein